VARENEGRYRGATVEGLDTYTAHLRSEFNNWAIGVAVPAAFVDGGSRRAAWILGIGAGTSMLLAVLVAMLVGQRIASAISALASAARNVGTEPTLHLSEVGGAREVAAVATALAQGSAAVHERQKLIERKKAAMLEADQAKQAVS